MQGLFITLEGTEGSGKSSAAAYLKQELQKKNIPVVLTREPGGTILSEQIRNLLLHNQSIKIEPITELLLIFAARMQHVQDVIVPALNAKCVVICDRYIDASYAYQGAGRNLGFNKIYQLQKLVGLDCMPHLTLLFDVPVELGLQRANKRSSPDRFEQEDIIFFNKIREAYLHLAKNEPKRICIIDGSKPFAQVAIKLKQIITNITQQIK